VPVAAKSAALGDKTYPFLLNTGRVRDHWHTMTRTALSPRLGLHMGEPYLELHPSDAAALALTQAELAMVRSLSGTAILRVMISDTVAQGHPFAPMHWTGQTAPTGRIDALVAAVVDPISGQPASKSSPVSIAPYRPVWYGYAISAADITPPCRYWAKAAIVGGFQYELAGSDRPDDWGAWATAAFGAAPTAVLSDRSRGIYRAAIMANGALQAALFIAPQPIILARQHVLGQLGTDGGAILAGRPSAAQPDAGPTVCACMNVAVNTIISAIKARAQVSVDDIGQTLGAGSNCGSCRPEIAALIARHGCKIAAE
jgi:assimilatory nitrate reductase catalytic subunit